jgi:hypothetical protein
MKYVRTTLKIKCMFHKLCVETRKNHVVAAAAHQNGVGSFVFKLVIVARGTAAVILHIHMPTCETIRTQRVPRFNMY